MIQRNKVLFTAFLMTYFIFATALANAQGQTMLKGTVLDMASGKARGANIQIKSESGAIMKLKADPSTGNFEQILDRGKSYKVIVEDLDILRTEYPLQVIGEGNYFEQKESFKVSKLSVGNQIGEFAIFKNASDEIDANAENTFKEIMMTMRFNRSLFLEFKVSGDGSKADKELADKRAASLQNYCNNKMKPMIDKIKVQADYTSKNKDKKDLRLVIEKIENTMK